MGNMISENKSLQSGFSLIELMISLVIILAIIGMIAPSFARILGKGHEATTKSALKTAKNAITEYNIDTHQWPTTLADLEKRPEGVSGWSGPYLADSKWSGKDVEDAWGQPLVYKKNEKGVKPPYQLYSNGDPDKEEDRIDAE